MIVCRHITIRAFVSIRHCFLVPPIPLHEKAVDRSLPRERFFFVQTMAIRPLTISESRTMRESPYNSSKRLSDNDKAQTVINSRCHVLIDGLTGVFGRRADRWELSSRRWSHWTGCAGPTFIGGRRDVHNHQISNSKKSPWPTSFAEIVCS